MKSEGLKSELRKVAYSNLATYKTYKWIDYTFNYSLKPKHYAHNDIVVCGISRSGSSLIYNIAKYLLSYQPHANMEYFISQDTYYRTLREKRFLRLKKTHHFSYLLNYRIASQSTIGLFTHRNLLDIIASMIQKGWIHSVDDILQGCKLEGLVYNAILFARTENIYLFSYDQLLNDRYTTIKEISEILQADVSESDIQECFDKTSTNVIRQSTAHSTKGRVGDKKVDLKTGFHENHINAPEAGKWKRILSDNDVKRLEKNYSFNLYNEFFDYRVR